MKRLIYIRQLWLAIPLLSFGFGCSSILEQPPVSQIEESQFWTSNSDAEAGVAAVYDAMQNAYKSKYFLWGELRSDNFSGTEQASGEALQIVTNNLLPTNEGVTSWGALYQMIMRANLAIENIPTIESYDAGLLGEAHALRAFAYFDAIRVWGAVPLYTENIRGLDDNLFREKSTGDQIMADVILPDLMMAEELLENPAERFHFSLASLYCLQAEVYMHLREYENAKIALDKLVGLNEFSLVRTREAWQALFRNEPESAGLSSSQQETGPELIFSIFNELEEDGNRASGVYGVFFSGVPPYKISRLLEEKWISQYPIDSIAWHAKYPDFKPSAKDVDGATIYGDFRYFESREESKDIGDARCAKYNKTNYNAAEDDTDIVIYRYAGMLLLKAEAEVQLGNLQEAVNLLNQIRQARDLPTVALADFQSSEQLYDMILDERQFELLAEGKRWWDLIRTDKAVEVMNPINGLTSDKLLFPIYFKHLIDNANLTQTPGY